MDTQQINQILGKQCSNYLGTFPINHLPLQSLPRGRQFFMTVNLDACDKPGSHWVALHLYQHRGMWYGEYFDSFGQLPPHPIVHFFTIWCQKRWVSNPLCLQSVNTHVCGCYCIYFITQRSHNVPFHKIIQCLQDYGNDRDRVVSLFCRKLQ